jgi:Carboxypeptidase regulatory-like domain
MMRNERASRIGAGARRTVCAAALAALAFLLPSAGAQSFGLKNVQGKVLDAQNAPINGAIVYLENKRNDDIKTFISTSNGSYRFADLAADTDYSLWAAWHGKKSAQKTVSSFDSRKQINIDLKIK